MSLIYFDLRPRFLTSKYLLLRRYCTSWYHHAGTNWKVCILCIFLNCISRVVLGYDRFISAAFYYCYCNVIVYIGGGGLCPRTLFFILSSFLLSCWQNYNWTYLCLILRNICNLRMRKICKCVRGICLLRLRTAEYAKVKALFSVCPWFCFWYHVHNVFNHMWYENGYKCHSKWPWLCIFNTNIIAELHYGF